MPRDDFWMRQVEIRRRAAILIIKTSSSLVSQLKMEEPVIERARRQRFTSILCRYPKFMLETDEDDNEAVREFEQRHS